MLQVKENLQNYLKESEYVDFSSPEIKALASTFSAGLDSDEAIAKKCFEYVRDHIRHTGDYKDQISTYKASNVLKYKTGWCYAKSILLATLLRANGIPTGFCYQRQTCFEYKEGVYCLHGLNAIYLKKYGWYRVDARGNKDGVDAQFTPPVEKLAFVLGENEYDLEEIYDEPLSEVLDALKRYETYDEMINHFPDIKE